MIGFPAVLGAGLLAFFPFFSLLCCLPFIAELSLPFDQSNLRGVFAPLLAIFAYDGYVFTRKRIQCKTRNVRMEIYFEATSRSTIVSKKKRNHPVLVAFVGKFSNIRDTFKLAITLGKKEKRIRQEERGSLEKEEPGEERSQGERERKREQKEIKERRRNIFLWTMEQPPCDYPGRGAYMSNLYSARSSVSKFEST
mgnify:CR=1 FL=1